MKKIIIAGGTGFIGKYLASGFLNLGYQAIIISRKMGDIHWDNQPAILEALENAEMLINLAGKSVDCRYNNRNKREILLSRTETTKALGEAMLKCNNPPLLWINSSTATIYRHAEDHGMTEGSGEIGSGFSVDVARSWEKSFFSVRLPRTRQVALRMAIVLGPNGGVIKPFVNLVRYGLGGRQGNGRQIFSWIHIEDLFQIVLYIQSHKELSGIFNCSAPGPVTNEELMKTFRKILYAKWALPSPTWLLKIGAVIISTETELILKSRWVLPQKLLNAGYEFRFPELKSALMDIVQSSH
jgi:uncharacterized protein (TIGR01777 family)